MNGTRESFWLYGLTDGGYTLICLCFDGCIKYMTLFKLSFMNGEKDKKYARKLYLTQSSFENVWNKIKLINIKLCCNVSLTVMERVLTTVSFRNLGANCRSSNHRRVWCVSTQKWWRAWLHMTHTSTHQLCHVWEAIHTDVCPHLRVFTRIKIAERF